MAKLTKLLSWIGLFSVLLTSAVSADPINIESLRTSSKQRQENSLTEPPVLSPTLSPALSQGLPQITDLQIVPSDTGLTLNLSTTGPIPEPETSTSGNALIFEISGATLAIPEEDLQQFEPADGIVLVQVSQVSEDRVRVAITGTDALPAASTTVSANGLAIAIAPGIAVTNEDDDSLRIVVTGDQDEGYNPSSAGTATGTDTLLRDVPFSVQVIPRAVIEDRNVTELGDVLETAGSVVEAGGRGASVFGPNFLLRGFPVSDGIFRDGISTFSLAPLSSNDIEQVEVLRGPASVLFGQGEPGGINNLVSKRPLSEPI
ncbi:MAG: TonB-dependent receptor plug domain-containing protein [Cyanobacteria bacterium J06649_4]